MSKAPEFSVVVIFGRRSLEPALSSLLGQEHVEFEVVGVAPDDSLKTNDPRVKLLVVKDPNPAQRRNLAAAASSGKYLAFIDDDAAAPPNWLLKAKHIFTSRQDLAGFGGTNIAPEKMSWREQLVDLLLTDRQFGSGSNSYQSSGQAHPARPGELHLCNFFLRRDIFDAVKGFNPKIGYGGEDSEMVYTIQKRLNRELWFFPEISVVHRRREFGREYLSRNFRFRRQNGRLMVLYPEMYRWNRSLWAGFSAALLMLVLLLFFPSLAALYVAVYFFFFSGWSLARLRGRKWLALIGPLAYLLHHLSYVSGLTAGLLEGLFKGRKFLMQLYSREDFAESPSSAKL